MPFVRLHDGREVDSSSEAWRHEAEARHILRLPTAEDRREWLAKIEAKRGKAAADRLRDTGRAIWSARRPPGGS